MTRTTNAASKGRRTPPPAPTPTTTPATVPAADTTLQLVDPAPIVAAIERLTESVERLHRDALAMPNAIAGAVLLEQRRARAGAAAPPAEPAFVTEVDAATIASVSVRALRVMVDEMRFPRPVRIGGNPSRDRRFVRAEVLEWVEARKAER